MGTSEKSSLTLVKSTYLLLKTDNITPCLLAVSVNYTTI